MFGFGLNIPLHVRILTPLRKRMPRTIAFGEVMLSGIKRLHTNVFLYFYNTANYPLWNSVTSYNVGSVVRFGYQVYESMTPNNLNNAPSSTMHWRKLQSNWIGGFQRSKVKAGKISLEKYLNEFFGTAFNYPASANAIYITTNNVSPIAFTVGISDLNTAQVSASSEGSIYFVTDEFSTYSQNSFTIYIPSALWITLESTNAKREALVKGVVNNYIMAGLQYNVTSY